MKTTQEQTKELTKEQKEIKEKIELLLKSNHTIEKVAKELEELTSKKVCKRTVYNMLYRLGIPRVGRKGRSGRKFKIC
jgi:hypothetical protein